MPRIARKKTCNAIFHVMCRSITEIQLFKDDFDKKIYMNFINKYQKLFKFRIFGYCLMDNHVHLIIDVNGSDISKVMHGINFSYAQYFNKRHKRHGHLFQDRFKSKMVQSERYLLTLSAYVHNNPIDIQKYKKCPEQYEFSSLATYLGLRKDPYLVIDIRFIMSFLGNYTKTARKKYLKLVYKCDDIKLKQEVEFENQETEYRSERKILVRNFKIEDIIEFVSAKFFISKINIYMKNRRDIIEARSILTILMRSLCNYKCSEICSALGNITAARVSRLSSIGIELIRDNEGYRNIIEEFIGQYAT
ncbi:MAG: transposase [Clostridiaceae bacterium]|nr:transposase [Clostridiaceae bacterium]